MLIFEIVNPSHEAGNDPTKGGKLRRKMHLLAGTCQ